MYLPWTHRGQLLLAALVVAALTTLAIAAGPVAAKQTRPRTSDGAVSTAAQFPVANWTRSDKDAGRVDTILRVGGTTYVGGNFTLASDHSGDTVSRTYLAAVDGTTGVLERWSPDLNGRVSALAASPDGSLLYVGGDFTQVDGQSYPHLVAFDLSTGDISPRLPPTQINGTVRTIAAVGPDIYIGGGFSRVAGETHRDLARLSPDRSGRWSVNSSFRATADGDVRDLIGDGTGGRLIAGGTFERMDGVKGQAHIAAISTGSGSVLPWASHPQSDVLDLAASGNRLYAAMGGRGGTALAYDLSSGKNVWYYMTDGNVQAVTTVGGNPVFGMHGDYVAPRANQSLAEYGHGARIVRHKVFELSPDGVLQGWAPTLSSDEGVLGVWALDGSAGMLAVGGDFTAVDRTSQARFALFNLPD